MCPRKQYSYTSEDYLNQYLDKYASKANRRCEMRAVRSITWLQERYYDGNHKVKEMILEAFDLVKPKAPKTKRAWISPYPLKLSE